MYRIITFKLIIGLVALAAMAAPASAGSQPPSPAGAPADVGALIQKAPKAVFSKLKYEFEPVIEGVKITHDFIIENHGEAPLVIKNIRSD